MAPRPRRPHWKRRYTSFLHGAKSRPDPADESQRLTLFLTGRLLDLAEKLTLRSGGGSVQHFCETMLVQALEAEQSRHKIEDAEARHGAFEGLRAIADDPEYLAEWNASNVSKEAKVSVNIDPPPTFALSSDPLTSLPEPGIWPSSADAILHHAGLRDSEPTGLLPCLRRGEIPSRDTIEDLVRVLLELEKEWVGVNQIDRRLAHSLHQIAFESQVLYTDAWPNAFDNDTIDAIRAIQSMIDQLLSGESISF